MSRFNTTSVNPRLTKNKEGSKAYKLNADYELYTLVATSALSDKFYETSDDRVERLRKLITQCDSMFVAKLAIYARESMYLRSIPLVLTVELNKHLNAVNANKKVITKLSDRVIQRADEITELLAYYTLANAENEKAGTNGQKKKLAKLSKALQKGVANAFNKFDEYQFAKYNRKTDIKLKDALFVTHPKPKDKITAELFKKIADDTLETPKTWEVEMSTAKDKNKSPKEVWEDMIDSGKLGYMALMRNLRNILSAEVSTEHVFKVADTLKNPELVKKAKQLPFRFLAAFNELKKASGDYSYGRGRYRWGSGDDVTLKNKQQVGVILEALDEAIKASVENLKGFDRNMNVLIACDVSGSMMSPVSPKSTIEMYDIGLTLGMILQHKCKYVATGIFGDTFKTKSFPRDSILENVMKFKKIEGEVGYSTNGYKVLDYLIKAGDKVDKVMIFTDCQMWNSNGWDRDAQIQSKWNEYKKIAPEAKLYLFDLQGYGDTPIDIVQKDVHLIAGWSDKVFDILESLEKGEDAIKVINDIKM